MGGETAPGLRWPDLALEGGRLNWSAVREALPRRREITLLSGTRRGYELDAAPVDAVVDAGRRGGITVVCDLPRRLTDATQAALDTADLVVLVSPCDVRASAATGSIAPVLATINPNLGLVVRGPSPGGLRAGGSRRYRRPAAAGVDESRAPTRRATGTRWAAIATAIGARCGCPTGTCLVAGPEQQGGVNGPLIERVRERLAAESAPLGSALRPNVVAAAIRAESGGMLGDTEVLANLRVLQTELTGAGILEPLLCAGGTTDVLVTAPDAVWVDDGNGLRRSQIRFADEAAVRRLAQRLALAAGRRLDDAQPWVDGQLTGIGAGGFAVRLHAVLPPVAPGHLSVAACVAARHTGSGRTDRRGCDRSPGRRDSSPTSSPPGWPFWSAAEQVPAKRLCWPRCSARCRRANGSCASRMPPSWLPGILIWSSWWRAAPTSKASERYRCVNLSGRLCECGPTASWSARSGAPRWLICWRR